MLWFIGNVASVVVPAGLGKYFVLSRMVQSGNETSGLVADDVNKVKQASESSLLHFKTTRFYEFRVVKYLMKFGHDCEFWIMNGSHWEELRDEIAAKRHEMNPKGTYCFPSSIGVLELEMMDKAKLGRSEYNLILYGSLTYNLSTYAVSVVKPLVVDGSAKSHELFLAYDQFSLSELEAPVVLQEFVNHGIVYSVSVKVSLDATLTPWLRLIDLQLGLRLFNVDLIRQSGTEDLYYIIDINHFPGFGKMPEYEHVFTDFLLSHAKQVETQLLLEDLIEAIGTATDFLEGIYKNRCKKRHFHGGSRTAVKNNGTTFYAVPKPLFDDLMDVYGNSVEDDVIDLVRNLIRHFHHRPNDLSPFAPSDHGDDEEAAAT
ncbi:inositol-tetrakisphosphate 1-kinase 2 [Phtheirospermum japonicum]|uniref:inositol-1,3,4-trisphosphate 5/6-kinase n=1 Tax=Phtheirospermum japonicum TaxID=374723 RepID=A0A830D5N0_9LAMI|nr:inositol-tetrakisphosphate 1-kinase 2 [Phtheirospermum japonicum]